MMPRWVIAGGIVAALVATEALALAEEDETDRGGRLVGEGRKSWQLHATMEYHHLVEQGNVGPAYAPSNNYGDSDVSNNNLLYYLVGGFWDPTPLDRISAQWGVYEYFLKYQGESGLRSDDAAVAYTRTVPLPWQLTLQIQPRVDIGLSHDSVDLAGLIAAPRLGVSLERDFGPLNVYALAYAYYFIERYTSYVGGSPNPQNNVRGLVELTLSVPVHKPLKIGVLGTAGATWYHQVQDDGSSTTPSMYHSTSDPLVPNQPVSNSFGGEVYVRYIFPKFDGFVPDVLVAYANGDPTIGYQGLLRDGVGRFNIFDRHVSELYAELTVRY